MGAHEIFEQQWPKLFKMIENITSQSQEAQCTTGRINTKKIHTETRHSDHTETQS